MERRTDVASKKEGLRNHSEAPLPVNNIKTKAKSNQK